MYASLRASLLPRFVRFVTRVYPPFLSAYRGPMELKSFFTAFLSPSFVMASRRLARVFNFAYDTRRSTNGRSAFAFASVVEMRSSITRERERDLISARR